MRDAAINRWFARYRKRGDPNALAKVFDATAPELLRVAAHLVRDPVEAEDVVQSTFLAAIEGAERFDPKRRVLPWLVGILVRQVGLARRSSRPPDPARVPQRSVEDPADLAADHEVSDALKATLAGMSETYRTVLVPHLLEGATGLEIAAQLGIGPGAVRVRIHRGLSKLRKALPPAFATGALLGMSQPRGLAAVRAEVVQAALTSGAAVSAASVGVGFANLFMGVVMEKKIAALAVVLLLLGTGLVTLSIDLGGSEPSSPLKPPPDLEGDRDPGTEPTEETAEAGEQPGRDDSIFPGRITGLVVGPDRKTPVPGAQVVLGELGAPLRKTTTAQDGTFSFDGELRSGMSIAAAAKEHGHGRADRLEKEPVRVILKPGLSVSGTVKTETGAPVPGAILEFLDGDRFCFGSRTVTADADGHYKIRGLNVGISIRARSPDGGLVHAEAVPVSHHRPNIKRDIVVRPPTEVRILITEAGTALPIEGAEVAFFCKRDLALGGGGSDGLLPLDLLACGGIAATGPDGVACFGRVPSGEYFCLASAKDFGVEGILEMVRSGDGPVRLELSLSPAATIEGRVLHGDGRPAAGARVTLSQPGTVGSGPEFRMASEHYLDLPKSMWRVQTTDEHGGYRFTNVRGEGPADLHAIIWKVGEGKLGPFPLSCGKALQGMDLVLAGQVDVKVEVRSTDGQPLRGAMVSGDTGRPTDECGITVVQMEPHGRAVLTVSMRGFATIARSLKRPVPEGLSFTAVMEKAVPFSGCVVDETGRVPEGVTIRASVEVPQGDWTGRTSSPEIRRDGTFTCEWLPERPLRISVVAEGYERLELEVDHPGNQELELVLTPER